MTVYAVNGCGDNFWYGRFEDEGVYTRYIALSTSFRHGTAYPNCGWAWAPAHDAIDANAKLITHEMLDVVKTESDFCDFESMEGGAFFDDFDDVIRGAEDDEIL